MDKQSKVSILFSGGSDSSLAASLMCEQYEQVYLLTFYHKGIPHAENAIKNAKKLANKFGNDKITHEFIYFGDVFKQIYYGNYWKDIKKYKSFMTLCFCNACQLAMHTKTIIYNINHNIHTTCDGYKHEKRHIYCFMSDLGIKETKKFYQKYGIEYRNPVYSIVRTDWKLFDMGITTKKNIKFPNEGVDYTTQHHCRNGILVNTYLMGYYIPIYGHQKNIEKSLSYWKEKIELLTKNISNSLKL